MVFFRCCLYLAALFSTLNATDLKPWFPRYLEIQSRFTWLHEQYNQVKSGSRVIDMKARNDFYTGSLELAYFNLCGELEATFSATGRHHLGPDHFKQTLRYQILDDVTGDDLSLVAGVSLSEVFSLSLKDISTFHHGHFEAEFHLSAGREISCFDTWLSRTWAVVGMGIANEGSPWIHGEFAWEKNWFYGQITRLYSNLLFGLGSENLHLNIPFKGYGPIRHQSIDLGLLHRYTFENDLECSLGGEFRVLAKNCPRYVWSFFFSVMYPFGI